MGAMSAARPRPVLFIFDRNVDLCSAVQHGWTYAPLVSDMLGLKANRVDVMQGSSSSPAGGGGGAGATEKKSYELDEDDDFFWREHAASEFPRVAEEVEVQLKRYKADMDEINRSTALENVQNGAGGMPSASSYALALSVPAGPEDAATAAAATPSAATAGSGGAAAMGDHCAASGSQPQGRCFLGT